MDNPATNPLLSRILIWSCRHRRHLPGFHRFICSWLGSDIFCELPVDIHLLHPYGIVIHSGVELGEGCTVMQQVTLGAKSSAMVGTAVPKIAAGVYVGAGAKVLGGVTIGAGAVVGANAVVTRDIPPRRTVVGANRLLLPDFT